MVLVLERCLKKTLQFLWIWSDTQPVVVALQHRTSDQNKRVQMDFIQNSPKPSININNVMVDIQLERNVRILQGFAECCVGEDQAERTGWETEALLANRQLLRARGALEESAAGRAGTSEGINTRSHSGFSSDPEPFIGGRRAQSLFFKLLGLKSGFIFTLASQPVCSSEPWSGQPPLWGVIM